MMKMTLAVQPGITIEFEAQTAKDVFKGWAYAHDIFGIKVCGNCKSPNIKPSYRTAKRKDNGANCEYYSIKCDACRHEFKFGQKQEQGQPLFPKGWEPPFQGDDNAAPSNGQQPTYHNQESPADWNQTQYAPPQYNQQPPMQQQRAPQPVANGSGLPF